MAEWTSDELDRIGNAEELRRDPQSSRAGASSPAGPRASSTCAPYYAALMKLTDCQNIKH